MSTRINLFSLTIRRLSIIEILDNTFIYLLNNETYIVKNLHLESKKGEKIMKRITQILLLGVVMMSVMSSGFAQGSAAEKITAPPREFRAVWVATVANIDWPSEPGLSVEDQKKEAIDILDKCVELNLNCVVFQVRPQADALYESKLEPWSYYLTGKMGQAPDPFYDPLKFWIDESHKRGLELHAWFNPYRANHPANKSDISDDSIVKEHPELVVKLGDKGYWWMDPAIKEVQDRSTDVIMDVVKRYDVDGIHFDDYFYPYASYNDNKDFPDDKSWEKYQEAGGGMSRGDWRRNAVNTFIQRVYNEIKSEKPHVKFGISPFGIWRPGHPESIRGLDQYASLYADARLWFTEGWVDYMTPQLYWPISQIPQSFPVLLAWWDEQNLKDRHLWPGTSIGRARNEEGATEIINQIMITRAMVDEGPGMTFFSMKTLMSNPGGLNEKLMEGPYKGEALIPAMPWLADKAPQSPKVNVEMKEDKLNISWKKGGDQDIFYWVLYTLDSKGWSWEIFSMDKMQTEKAAGDITRIAVSAIDRFGQESPRTVSTVQKPAEGTEEQSE